MDKGVRCVRWGYEINTSTPILTSISLLMKVLSYGRERKVILEAPLHDDHCVLANILAAHFISPSDPSRASAYIQAARPYVEHATTYEQKSFEVVSYLISEDRDDDMAFELHAGFLKKYPKDLVALKRAQILCFYSARPDLFLGLAQEVLPENKDEGYAYGMLAFPLLELGRMAEAEAAAKKAYEINRNDSWAHHCLCHVLQYECRFKEAVEFMEECSASWASLSSFMYTHNWWHVALCYLEGGSPIGKVSEIYDHHIWKELEKSDAVPPEVYLNALGMILRLDVRDSLDGFEDRLKILSDRLTDQACWYLEWHLDILTIWALTKVGETSKAQKLLDGLKFRTSRMNKKKRKLMQKGIRLGEAVYEYARGNYKQTLELLGPDFDAIDYKIIGASDEQIDVFGEIWCKALILNGQSSTAMEVIKKRLENRDGVPFTWRLLSYAMEGSQEAQSAAGKAMELEAYHFKSTA
ncbi:PREDICTED: tetratricopeptide repeat protein 38 isoform X2 [Tarenaya hassleriana]|uniref:tetratricopeptide repeat protein 38 isoform X2 n=1 Tax=Tarenaya hassleriana TaxID=28532 RepID=UPI00053C7BF4|nr:PREDICTED: tetratricopeptide repeat protein 38 isoform X2 [Tarenaya hassleriana]